MATRIGIDVGGTFTDFILTRDGAPPLLHKVLSTPADPSIAVVEGLVELAAMVDPAQSVEQFAASIDTIVHGTTVTTNATLTGTGAKSALITTEGVRDALEMRRGIREEQYNNAYTNVKPLVPRYLRIGVPGRLDRAGRELTPLSLPDVRRALELFRAGRRAGGVDLLHEFVRESCARAGRRGAGARNDARCLPHRLVRPAAVDPVLRPALDDRAQFVRRPEAQPLSRAARQPVARHRLRRPPADHAEQRRRDGARDRPPQRGAHAAVRARGWTRRGPVLRQGAGFRPRRSPPTWAARASRPRWRWARRSSSTTARSRATGSRCRCSTSTPSAPGAARSAGSTRAGCCAWARRARGPTRARRAT